MDLATLAQLGEFVGGLFVVVSLIRSSGPGAGGNPDCISDPCQPLAYWRWS